MLMKTLKKWKQPSHQMNRIQHQLVRAILQRRGFDLRSYSGYFEMYHMLTPEQVVRQHFHNQVENQIHLIKNESSQILHIHKGVLNRLEQVQKTVRNNAYTSTDLRTINHRMDRPKAHLLNRYLTQYQGGISEVYHGRNESQAFDVRILNLLNGYQDAGLSKTEIELLTAYLMQYESSEHASTQRARTHLQMILRKNLSWRLLAPFLKHSNTRRFRYVLRRHMKRHSFDKSMIRTLEKTFNKQFFKEPILSSTISHLRNQSMPSEELFNTMLLNDSLNQSVSASSHDTLWRTFANASGFSETLTHMFYDASFMNQESMRLIQQSSFQKQLTKRIHQTVLNTERNQWQQKELGYQYLVSRLQYLFKSMSHQHSSLKFYGFAHHKRRIRKQEQFVEKVMNQVFLRTQKTRATEQRKRIQNVMKNLLKDQRFFSSILELHNQYTGQSTMTRHWQLNRSHQGDLFESTFLNSHQRGHTNHEMRRVNMLDSHFYNHNLMASMGDEIKRFNTVYQIASQKELDKVVAHFIENNQILLNRELYERFRESNRIDTYTNQFLTNVHMDQTEEYNPFAHFNYNTILNYLDLNRSYEVDKSYEINRISKQTEERTQKEVQIYESIAKQKLLHQLKKTYEKNMVKYYRSQFLDHAVRLKDQMSLLKSRMDFRTNRIADGFKGAYRMPWLSEMDAFTPMTDVNVHERLGWLAKQTTHVFNLGSKSLVYNQSHLAEPEIEIYKRNLRQRKIAHKHQKMMQKQELQEAIQMTLLDRQGYETRTDFEWRRERRTRNDHLTNHTTDSTEVGYETKNDVEIYKMEATQNTEAIERITSDLEKRLEQLTEEIQVIRNQEESPLNLDKLSDQIFRRLNQRMKVERQRRGVI